MVTVGIKELKAKLSGYVDKVRHGEELVITEHGKEVAMVIPISAERRAMKSLLVSGKAKWSGGKPAGLAGIRTKGETMAKTVLAHRK